MENETRKKSLLGISGLLTKIEADPVQLSGNFGKIQILKLRCIHVGTCRSAWLSVLLFLSLDIQSLQTGQLRVEKSRDEIVTFTQKAGT